MIQVEIQQYRALTKPSVLAGFFTLVILVPGGQKIRGCKAFQKDGEVWFAFPSEEIPKGQGKDYIPYVSYADKEYLEDLKTAVVKVLKPVIEQARNGQNPISQGAPAAPSLIQGDTPNLWD